MSTDSQIPTGLWSGHEPETHHLNPGDRKGLQHPHELRGEQEQIHQGDYRYVGETDIHNRMSPRPDRPKEPMVANWEVALYGVI